jgi:putative SOS response-associated peptidase YedK
MSFAGASPLPGQKPMFKDAWEAGRRCLIPVNAYYEWVGTGKEKQPYAIARQDGKFITLAGLWEAKKLENGDILRTFTVITTAAYGGLAELHSRIPVMIEESDWAGWLGEQKANPRALLRSPDNELLTIWAVSRAVGNVRNNEVSLFCSSYNILNKSDTTTRNSKTQH